MQNNCFCKKGFSNNTYTYTFLHLVQSKGPCINSRKRYYFNKRAGKCEEFTYGGCKGNANNFLTYDTCYSKCLKQMYHGKSTTVKQSTTTPTPQIKNNLTVVKDSDDNTKVCKQSRQKGDE